jgi:hypothetical protein
MELIVNNLLPLARKPSNIIQQKVGGDLSLEFCRFWFCHILCFCLGQINILKDSFEN